jgi:hypothetical protein
MLRVVPYGTWRVVVAVFPALACRATSVRPFGAGKGTSRKSNEQKKADPRGRVVGRQ